ncbi:hypothetical protein OG552_31610 [Streptomyces sp. NBC_01476]|uniref:hypothetical protein n=1 Tax=Streptomyces sp. NBC_01476 TaxID=2903881 RepID=UPI002E303A14|nr:hypothetical protein [Streptomyces sp. NBC_01476]
MITHAEDGPDFTSDDPLAVILRPTPEYFGPPPGTYRSIRRRSARRRLLRTAAGVGLTCAVAALIALPLRLTSPQDPAAPATPAAPLAPPPVTAPSAPSATPTSSGPPQRPRPTRAVPSQIPGAPAGPAVATPTPTRTPPPTSTVQSPLAPSSLRNAPRPTPDDSHQP